MNDRIDLSGAWAGVYSSRSLEPPVHFDALLRDVSGVIEGRSSERQTFEAATERLLTARIEGQRRHRHVTFWKTYAQPGPDRGIVLYDGQIDSDGHEISGRWIIPGAGVGTFLMIRAATLAGPAATATDTGSPTGPQ